MESLKLSFGAVGPIFLLMILGYTAKSLRLADKKIFDGINKLVFKIFLPTLLFYNIYKTKTNGLFDLKLILFTVIGVLCVFFVFYFLTFRLSPDNRKRGVILQSSFRSNFAILGLPLVNHICAGRGDSLASLMVAIVVPLFNVLAVISLERFRGGDVSPKKLFLGIIKNPLIVGCFIGAVFLFSGIKLPSILEKTVSDVSSVATPMAIFVLGANFTFSSIKGYAREIAIIVSTRLIFVPLIMLSAAVLLGFRGEALACLLVTFSSPVAVSSFAMAQQMDADETLQGHAVIISSALCLVTIFIEIFVLNSMGLF